MAAILLFCGFIADGFSQLGAQNRRAPAVQKGSGSLVFSPANQQQAGRSLARLPWAFEPNVGQTDARVKFLARADGATVFLAQTEAVIAWSAPRAKGPRAAQKSENDLRLQFVGASQPKAVSGENELPGKTNYLLGSDPRQWRTNIPHFSAVAYDQIYPGINARFYGGARGLEYDVEVLPGGDFRDVVLRTGEANQLRLDSRGNLLVHAAQREILMRRPEIFQLDGIRKIPVEGGYRLLSDNSFGFRVGAHRDDLPLIIDPSISVTYTSFLGGNGAEKGNSVAVAKDSVTGDIDAYVGGTTTIAPFSEPSPAVSPTTLGSTSGSSVLFVAKVDTTQSGAASLIYLTFIGGTADNEGGIVAVDNSVSPPNLAILGWTTSADFPVTIASPNPGSTLSGTSDLTVSKLNGAGSAFVYSEYYGGSGMEATQGTGAIVTNSTGGGIATDSSGDVFVTSDTTSIDLPQPAAPNGFQPLFEGTGLAPTGTNNDGFLAKFDPSGAVLYSTYFGIAANVGSTSVAVDTSGNAYAAGFTSQPSNSYFPPVTANPFQPTFGSGATENAIVLEINPALVGPTSLVYASFLGGSGADKAFAIGVDTASPPSAYIIGSTNSTDFVSKTSLTNGFQMTLGSGATKNAFLAVIAQTSSTSVPPFVPSLSYASYLGGTNSDSGQGVAVVLPSSPGPSTDVLVTGKTTSSSFPVFCPSQAFTGSQDAFIAAFNPTASGFASLLDSTFLGGSASTEANAIATDSSGDAIIFGETTSSDYLANNNPNNGFQLTCASCGSSLSDAFLTKLAISTAPSACVAFTAPSTNFGSFPVGSTSSVSPPGAPPINGTATNDGNATLTFSGFSVVNASPAAADFPILSSGGISCSPATVLAPGALCDFAIGFDPTIAGAETGTLQITGTDSAGNNITQGLTFSGIGTAPEVSLSPNTGLTFGSLTVSTTSSPQVVTLTNTGNAPLNISSVTLDPAQDTTDFILNPTGTANACGSAAPIPPNGTCNIAVEFAPKSVNSFFGQVDIVDDKNNVSGATQTIALSGTGISQTFIVGISPTSLTFPNQTVGTTTSSPMNVTLTNTGTGTLNIMSITPTGTNASEFLIDSTTTCPIGGAGVGPNGGACVIAVDFAPTAVGTANADISVADNASNSPQTVPVMGTGAGAVASITTSPPSNPPTLTFGSVQVGTTSSVMSATLTNTGNSNLVINANGLTITGANPVDFQLAAQTTCSAGGSGLPPNGSCVIAVDFAPQASGPLFASVSIADNAGGSPQTISLSGTGTQPVASLSQTSVNFGSVNVNTPSPAPTVTLTNSGNQTLTISSVSVNPAFGNPGDFTFSSAPGSNTCKTVGALQPVGANPNSCTITITFTPAAQGSRIGEVDITDDAPGSPQTIALSGTGTAPGVSLSPTSLSFPNQNVGSISQPQTVTLTNNGTGPLTITSISVPCPGSGDFCQTNSCPGTLNPTAFCVVSLTFTPTAKGARSASLSISDTGPGSPQTVALSGTGTQPAVAFNPSTGVSFPATVVGTASGTRSLTVTNTGDGPLDVSSITFNGTNAGDFSETDNCAGSANAVAPQKFCTINVNFVPTVAGARSANLVVADNAASPMQQVPVGGQATDFQLAASGGSTSATITAGETAIFPLQLNPQNGFTGTVNFGCTNPPPKGSCTVAPPSLQITGSTPVSFSVSVGTKSNGFLIPHSPRSSPKQRIPRIPAFLWWLAAILCLFFWRRTAGRRRRLVPRFVLAFAVLLLASCGGGGGSTGGGNGTPPGTYTVTATGSVGSGAARTLNLTVMVQ
ncbi:MAG TPA: choice-of-anchor D domain-containing protein [Candidatus Acidoferrales bacterium]|nr:choice-of-anchor D domain-containing protein [Candidatus Acidoferrales bacterium]